MFYSIWIHETYTNPEIVPSFESARPTLVNTNIYKNSSQEQKILIDEYLEVDVGIKNFFYTNGQVNKLIDNSNCYQIIQIILPNNNVWLEYIQNSKYNALYYQHLTLEVWTNIFGVNQEIIHLSDQITHMLTNYEDALIYFTKNKSRGIQF